MDEASGWGMSSLITHQAGLAGLGGEGGWMSLAKSATECRWQLLRGCKIV